MSNSTSEKFTKVRSDSKKTFFNIEYIWKIDQFKEKFKGKDRMIKSSKFSVPGHDIELQLKLYPRGKEKNNSSSSLSTFYLYCYLKNLISGEVKVTNELDFLSFDVTKQVEIIKIDSITFKESNPRFVGFFYNSDVLNPNKKILHENGQLHLRFKATVSYKKASKFILNQFALLTSGKNSDVTIVVGNTNIPVHKNILSAHSPVFEAMFSHNDTKEAQEHKVDIPDVSFDVMFTFLKFIYTGVNPNDHHVSLELLVVSDKYQVDELKLYCEAFLSTVLKVENVVESFQIADLQSANTLKANCLTFMASNFNQVVQTEAWKRMCAAGGELMVKVISEVAKTLASKNGP